MECTILSFFSRRLISLFSGSHESKPLSKNLCAF
jgi:hypothetical protein